MSDEGTRLLAAAWLDQQVARHHAEEAERAEAWVIIVTCVEGGETMTWVHGPVEDQVEALRLAEKHEGELNAGNAPGDDPFVAKVYPMNRPTGW